MDQAAILDDCAQPTPDMEFANSGCEHLRLTGDCVILAENARLLAEVQDLLNGSLRALTRSIDARDRYTRGHSERVAFIARWLAERLLAQGWLPAPYVQRVYVAGLMHDVGKIGIPDALLRRRGPLTDSQRKRIQSHPVIGAGIVSGIRQLRDIVPGVLCHHERYDGRGYPEGLPGESIPLVARVLAIADSFDAMTSSRAYRDAMPIESALDQIRAGLGLQFDPDIGTLFLASDVHHLWQTIQDSMADRAPLPQLAASTMPNLW